MQEENSNNYWEKDNVEIQDNEITTHTLTKYESEKTKQNDNEGQKLLETKEVNNREK